MQENRVHALAEFLKIVPETLKLKGRKFEEHFSVIDSGQRVVGLLDIADERFEPRFDFDPNVFKIVGAHCTCDDGERGRICEHLVALATHLSERHFPENRSTNQLDFLDKHFQLPAFQNAQFHLSIELEEQKDALEPLINIHKYIKEGTWGVGRRFTANDSYKFSQGEPTDQGLLDYIGSFRQILFYSNYSAADRFNWGFWLSLLGHPRVSIGETRLNVSTAPARLDLISEAGKWVLTVDHDLKLGSNPQYFEVNGGVLVLCKQTGNLLVCQLDAFRRDILMEINQYRPKLNHEELLANLTRLERLQKLFNLKLPDELEGVIQKEPASMILQLDLQPGRGFVVSPRIKYGDAKARLLPGVGPNYLPVDGNKVVERDMDEEQDKYEDFLNKFPFEEKPDREQNIIVNDLERALVLIDWIKNASGCELEWLRQEPKIHHFSSVQGLRVQIDSKAWLKIHLMSNDKKTFTINQFAEDDTFLANTGYVAVGNGEWLQIDNAVRQQLNQLKMAVTQEKRALKLKKAAMAVLAEMEQVDFEGDQHWLDRLDEWRGAKDEQYKPSKDLNAEMRKYQVEGYRWLRRMSDLGVGACLADDMGLGKTLQALAVLLDRIKTGPTLVVAPASVGYNWREEINQFAPTLRPILYAEGRRGKSMSRLKRGDVVIISYALVLKDIDKLAKVKWGTLVLDEAQFIKNALSQTAIAVSKLNRDWTLALTGTPLENHLGELWSIFRMLNADLLGAWDVFRKTYVAPIEKARDPEKLENLRRLIKPFILRRTKQNVLDDLPERSDIILKVELGEAQRTRYEAERGRVLSQLDEVDERVRFKLLAAITRLRQLACHPALCEPRYKGESAKLKVFSELVEELVSENHRLLVFSQFTSFLSLIAHELNRIHVPHVMMTGETPVKHRQTIIERFQTGEVPVFLVSLRAGGTGLNLTQANYVVHMDPWWNPAVEEQATDRAHRIGQAQAVTVYRLVATNTIEEAILNIHNRKRDLVQSLLDGQEGVGKLSIGDLIGLIKGEDAEAEEGEEAEDTDDADE